MGSISKLIIVLICSVFGSYFITKILNTISLKSRNKSLEENQKTALGDEANQPEDDFDDAAKPTEPQL